MTEQELHNQDNICRLQFARQQLADNITIDKQVRGGIPCVKDTQISVGQILAELADRPLPEIADAFELDLDVLGKIIGAISIMYDVPHDVTVEAAKVPPSEDEMFVKASSVLNELQNAYSSTDRARLDIACRRASAWIEHGVLLPRMKQQLINLLREAEKALR